MSAGYFLAKFGDQISPPQKDPVESGRYIPRDNWVNYENVQVGDLMLLYCTGSYIGYDREVPAIGVVLRVEPPAIHYRYLPLSKSITLDDMRHSFSQGDKTKLDNLRFDSFNIFTISADSFKHSVESHSIFWSKV